MRLSPEGNRTSIQLFEMNLRLLQFQFLVQSGMLEITDLVSRSSNDVHVIPPQTLFNQRTTHPLARFVSQNRHVVDDFTLYQRLSALVSRFMQRNINDAMYSLKLMPVNKKSLCKRCESAIRFSIHPPIKYSFNFAAINKLVEQK